MPGPAAQQARPDFRPCVLIPTFDNPLTVRDVVEGVRKHVTDVIVVDDGSGREGEEAVADLGHDGLAHVVRRERNGGKGAAVREGFELARRMGYTHALQVDADAQHALDDIPRFLEHAAARPDALILGAPVFDESAPRIRLTGRKITRFWTRFEVGGPTIEDPMCGFRVYPLDAAIAAHSRGNRMEFDIEIAVRMVWRGAPAVNLPTRVRYLPARAGGVSHFRLFRDNVRISWLHTRLVIQAISSRLIGSLRRWLIRSS
jgi:glycosyltransferase involved in cell wall biosynthesis